MKLRNKQTGQEGNFIINKDHFECANLEYVPEYRSLCELNAEWEDYSPAERKPRRYRLLKDLPTFNKGDEFYIAQTGALWYDGGGDDDVCAYATQTLMRFPNILEDWFEEIKPVEPLIKDEKIRKAVRAWADANDLFAFKVVNEHFDCFKVIGYGDHNISSRIEFKSTIAHANKDQFYTIAELCGEGEE